MSLPANLIGMALAVVIMTAGTILQSTVGFGLGLMAGPLLVLIDRSFLPGPMLFAAMFLAAFMAFRERRDIDWRGLKISILGRLVSTLPAALVVGMVSATVFDIIFGCLILAAVGMSLIHTRIMPTRRNVFLAAIASGVMSTIGAIGGPPLALVYQNMRGPQLRATLGALFAVGCLISLIALTMVGRFRLADLVRGGVLLTGVVAGLLFSRPLLRVLDQYSIRPYVLGMCTLAAVVVLIRAIMDFV